MLKFSGERLNTDVKYSYEQKTSGKYETDFQQNIEQTEQSFKIETNYYPWTKQLSIGPGYQQRYVNKLRFYEKTHYKEEILLFELNYKINNSKFQLNSEYHIKTDETNYWKIYAKLQTHF